MVRCRFVLCPPGPTRIPVRGTLWLPRILAKWSCPTNFLERPSEALLRCEISGAQSDPSVSVRHGRGVLMRYPAGNRRDSPSKAMIEKLIDWGARSSIEPPWVSSFTRRSRAARSRLAGMSRRDAFRGRHRCEGACRRCPKRRSGLLRRLPRLLGA
jgi:hypothetical protein